MKIFYTIVRKFEQKFSKFSKIFVAFERMKDSSSKYLVYEHIEVSRTR